MESLGFGWSPLLAVSSLVFASSLWKLQLFFLFKMCVMIIKKVRKLWPRVTVNIYCLLCALHSLSSLKFARAL